jgi:hypothetical protein
MNELPKHDTTKSPISSEYGTTAHRGYGQAHRPAVDAGPEAQALADWMALAATPSETGSPAPGPR